MLLKKSARFAAAALALALFGCSDDDGVSANNHIVLTSSSSVHAPGRYLSSSSAKVVSSSSAKVASSSSAKSPASSSAAVLASSSSVKVASSSSVKVVSSSSVKIESSSAKVASSSSVKTASSSSAKPASSSSVKIPATSSATVLASSSSVVVSSSSVKVASSSSAALPPSSSSAATVSSSAKTPSSSAATNNFFSDNWRQACLDKINEYRATENLAPLTLAPEAKQTCTDKEAADDLAANKAHGHFGDCGEWAQNSGPNFSTSWRKNAIEVSDAYLKMMWEDEKALVTSGERDPQKSEDYPYIGHYLNMKGNYKTVACGIALSDDGKKGWFNVNFF